MRTIVFSFIIFLVFASCCADNDDDELYEECVAICHENEECTKREIVKSENSNRERSVCVEDNLGDCLNICVEKYK